MGSLYSEYRTWLHAVPAFTKLLLLAVLGTLLFVLNNPVGLLASTALCCLLFLSLGQATRSARRLLVSVVVAGLLVVVFHTVMGQPVLGLTSFTHLLCASLLGISVTLTTRSSELLEVFEKLLAPLKVFGINPNRLSMQVALMLRFTEHFFIRWKRLDDAYRVRTGKRGGLQLLAPLTIQMLLSARRVADTLQVRLGELD